MKTNSIRYSAIWCLLLMLIVAVSCKDDTVIEPIYDGIKMRVSLSSGFFQAASNGEDTQSKASIRKNGAVMGGHLEPQTQVISLGNGLSVEAILVPQQETADMHDTQVSAAGALKATAARGGFKAALQKNNLAVGTRYRLLVYDAADKEIKRVDKTVADENSSAFDEVTLDAAGTTTKYTFVAYSAGTAALPDLAPNSILTSAIVAINNNKFMHYVEELQLSAGTHDLEVVLDNKLTEITTVLDGQGIGVNAITGVGNFTFKSATHNGGTLNLSNGMISYSGTAQDKAVIFPAIPTGMTEVRSSPTALLHGQTTTANLEVQYIEIDGLGRSEPFVVSNVKIEPGVKYNLVLKLNKGNCLIDVAQEYFSMDRSQGGACRVRFYVAALPLLTWYNYGISQNNCSGGTILLGFVRSWRTANQMSNSDLDGHTLGRTYEFSSSANAGVVINITRLDNSFNMAINDPADDQNTAAYKIATKEIQFQGTGANGRNIRFTNNGGQHGAGGMSNVWEITNGTLANPVLRVSISASGSVSIEGRKDNNDLTLYPMELHNNTSFNTIIWNTSSNNKVTITQLISGATYIDGYVAGKRLDDCP